MHFADPFCPCHISCFAPSEFAGQCDCRPAVSVSETTTQLTWEAGRDQKPATFLPGLGHLTPHFATILSVVLSRRTRATKVPALWSTETMSVVFGCGAAEEMMSVVLGFGWAEQP
jgi:hypothetical protein